MKTVQTNREDLYINDYIVLGNAIFDVIEIEYKSSREAFIIKCRNIETNETSFLFAPKTFKVLVKN